jgi:hypothetical protein
MKQATVKSLGVAALGVALSAVVAGTASAVTDDVEQTAGGVVNSLPDVGQDDVFPDDDDQMLPLAGETLSGTSKASPLDGLTDPVTDLLGGLPVDPSTATGALGGLPLGSLTSGLPLN